jgi:hypothetical protein
VAFLLKFNYLNLNMKRKNTIDSTQVSKRNKIDGNSQNAEKINSKNSKKSNLLQKITKGAVGQGLDLNLRKIIENEKNLQNENNSLSNISQDSKIKILDEFIKKNFDLTEMDELLEEMKDLDSQANDLNEQNREKRLQNLAENEYIKTSIENSRDLKRQLHTDIALKEAETHILEQVINEEEKMVNSVNPSL